MRFCWQSSFISERVRQSFLKQNNRKRDLKKDIRKSDRWRDGSGSVTCHLLTSCLELCFVEEFKEWDKHGETKTSNQNVEDSSHVAQSQCILRRPLSEKYEKKQTCSRRYMTVIGEKLVTPPSASPVHSPLSYHHFFCSFWRTPFSISCNTAKFKQLL